MKPIKYLGIWMDHAQANLIEYGGDAIGQNIVSEFTHEKKIAALNHSESGMHRKELQEQTQYYKAISERILEYDKVLLFGPTNAKVELHNYLNKDLHFKDIEIEVKGADKMTDNEQVAFVRDHFKEV